MKKLEKRSSMFSNHLFVQITSLILSMAFIIVALPLGVSAEEKTTIKFMNPWVPSGAWGMFWSCQDRFWPEEGVYGEVLDGKGSGYVVKAVATGSCEMGYTGILAVMHGIQEGMPIKLVLIGAQNDATALITIKENEINTLKDYEGKTVGVFPYGHTALLVKALLKHNNVDLSKVRFTNVSPGSGSALLMKGKIDALGGIIASQDLRLLVNGYDPVVFPITDYGLSIYAFVLIINTDWEKKVGRETVLKYIRGIAKGFILKKTDVKQMIDDMVKYRSSEAGLYDLRLAECYPRWHSQYKSEMINKYGFGWIDKSRMEHTQNVFFDAGLLKKKIDVEEYYTMDYITDKSFSSLAMEYAKGKLDANLKAYYDKAAAKGKGLKMSR